MASIFKISARDVFKGFVVAFFSAVVTFSKNILQRMVDTGVFTVTGADLWSVPLVGIAAGLGYLLKQFFTDENGKLGGTI